MCVLRSRFAHVCLDVYVLVCVWCVNMCRVCVFEVHVYGVRVCALCVCLCMSTVCVCLCFCVYVCAYACFVFVQCSCVECVCMCEEFVRCVRLEYYGKGAMCVFVCVR